MIIHNYEQGSAEWHQMRLGIPTASEFNKIITDVKGDISKSAESYANLLVAEILTRETQRDLPYNKWLDRGSTMEAEAADDYASRYGVELRQVGLITNDKHTWGASLDRLIVGQKKAVELKCPKGSTQMDYFFGKKGVDKDYYNQLQGQMFVSEGEIEQIDIYPYHPKLPHVCITVERDDKRQAQLKEGLEYFRDLMGKKLLILNEQGFIKLEAA